jgi:hypothetical protein
LKIFSWQIILQGIYRSVKQNKDSCSNFSIQQGDHAGFESFSEKLPEAPALWRSCFSVDLAGVQFQVVS